MASKVEKSKAKQNQTHQKNGEQKPPIQYKKSFDPRLAHKIRIDVGSVEILLM